MRVPEPCPASQSTRFWGIETTPASPVNDALLAVAIEHAPVLIIIADSQGRILVLNKMCRALTGWRREDVAGRHLLDILGAGGERFHSPTEITTTHTSGIDRRIEWRMAPPAHWVPEDHILAIGIDLNGRPGATGRPYAELLRHMYRNMLTTLATTLSHEVSQPLSAVLAYVQGSLRLLTQGARQAKEITTYLDKACAQARRAADVARSMRSRPRNEAQPADTVDVNKIVTDIVLLLEPEFHARGITVDLCLAQQLPTVSINGRILELILFTLTQVSLEFLATTETTSARFRLATQPSAESGVEIVLSLEGGITPFHRPGEGLDSIRDDIGLGLTMCRSLLRDYEGGLELKPFASNVSFVATLPGFIHKEEAV
ncbi:MAG: PAS domain-containing protein [Rhodospirillales bacterium]